MNFLKLYSKFSKLSYTSVRNFAGMRESINNPSSSASKIPKSSGIGGEKRNTASDAGRGEVPRGTEEIGSIQKTSSTVSGNSRGETLTNRSSVLDTASGVGKNEKGKPVSPPSGLSEEGDVEWRDSKGPKNVGGRIITNEGLNEGPGTSKKPKE